MTEGLYYDVFVAHDWLIRATASFTGKPESEIWKVWNKAQKKGGPCTFRVAGDLPASKRCAACNTLARRNVLACLVCEDIFCQ